ncbi:WD40 repeat-like protein [Pleomassaria siparia CBS 279.74]|uniref:WD40 repeat-like protein n=1 Tax=Pleomassaria siparia CBS 279.74 TaxID=1314801 RepID=A0A6G1JZN5_9PLEO|nr:WD40 repeat-like protein [Pleomassaria siparia CBS 279.74]
MSSPFLFHGLPEPLLPSSPPPASMGTRKPKKAPPITPKRFTRFFTPRNSTHGSSSVTLGASGRQLQDITRAAVNRSKNDSSRTTPRKTVNFADAMVENSVETPKNTRKRKTPYLSPETSPAQSSPSKRSRFVTPPPFDILEDNVLDDDERPVFNGPSMHIEPIRRLKGLGVTSRQLQRSFGGARSIGRGFLRDHCTSWQEQTANFYSGADDYHQLPNEAPPFCTASCNTNALVAVGDEDGFVHFIDTDEDPAIDFSQAHVSWRAHTNAIMDLHFSSDDSYLATGSGDQTAQIIDARTQQCVSVLAKHKSSVKQVRFQPGDDKMVATSSRDGAVQIWDLRCKGGNISVHSAWGPDAPYASSVRTLASAHADSAYAKDPSDTGTKDYKESLNKSETPIRRNDISVTALSWLPEGREHLLLTASDASTCVKLWDIRGRYSLRGPAIPISTTRPPMSHIAHRHFAINSLTLSGDASRLYAISKDSSVYAYATSHLVLGVAPELSVMQSSKQRYCGVGGQGLEPIYSFRHRSFHAGSFYVKASLRKASGDRPELLAVGSTDGCPVLFPTDENFLKRESRRSDDDDLPGAVSRISRPVLSRNPSSSRFASTMSDTIPVYEHGTPLIKGHNKEVTSVCWASNGTLVSVGDDYRVRRWREGTRARDLRIGGEASGRRWRCGWADMADGFDDEE